jgi:two-component system LytT family response regulator
MKRVRVLVVDDEPLARAGVIRLLGRDPELEVIGEAGDGAAAVAAITDHRPDLVILDVQMPEMNGLEVIRAVGPDRMPPVIFVTAHDEFAVQAFEVHAADYLLKPFRDDRLGEAIARAKQQRTSRDLDRLASRLSAVLQAVDGVGAGAGGDGGYLDRLVVKTAGHAHLVRVADIDWIEAADYCAKLHVGGRRHVIRESMTSLEQRLDPRRFFRIHRSAIVNLDRVKEIEPFIRGDQVVVLSDGTKLKLSRGRREELETRLGQSL